MNSNINNSTINRLTSQDKVNDRLLLLIGSLTLEELIAVKLELSASHINNRLYGFDIWKKTSYIVKDAIMKFAISATKSKKDAARFLGITYSEFRNALATYNTDDFFSNDI